MTPPEEPPRRVRLDHRLIGGAARLRHPVLTVLMRGATHAGDKLTMLIGGVLLALTGGPRVRIALTMGLGAGLAGGGAQLVKRLFKRRRPAVGMPGFVSIAGNPDKFSFPSGHTATAFGAAVATFEHSGVYGLIAAAIVGFSRVYLGAHYPTDVAVGAVFGALMGLAARAIASLV